MMPRSQSVSQIDRLAPTPPNDAETEGKNRFRRRLDAIRGHLIARVKRKRSDVSTEARDDHRQKDDAFTVRQSEVHVVHESETISNGADTSSVAAMSSPITPLFDRRRIQRRTPRRHRTVVDAEQVEMARGFLRRNASSVSNTSFTKEIQQPKLDDVQQLQPSRFIGDAHQRDVNNDDVFADLVNHDIQQLPPFTRY